MRPHILLLLAALLLPTHSTAAPPEPEVVAALRAEDPEVAVAAAESLTPKDVAAHGDALATEVQTLARALHRKRLRDRERAAGPLAERVYRVWLAHFADRPDAAEMHNELAELLYKLKRYEAALDEYEAALQSSTVSDKAARWAARNAVWAGSELAKEDPGPRPERGSSDPVELSAGEARSLAAHDAFVARFPDDPDAPDVAYGAAWLLYEHNRLDDAAERLKAIVESSPDSKGGQAAVRLLRDLEERRAPAGG